MLARVWDHCQISIQCSRVMTCMHLHLTFCSGYAMSLTMLQPQAFSLNALIKPLF